MKANGNTKSRIVKDLSITETADEPVKFNRSAAARQSMAPGEQDSTRVPLALRRTTQAIDIKDYLLQKAQSDKQTGTS